MKLRTADAMVDGDAELEILFGSGFHRGEPRIWMVVRIGGAQVCDIAWSIADAEFAVDGLRDAVERCRALARGGSSS